MVIRVRSLLLRGSVLGDRCGGGGRGVYPVVINGRNILIYDNRQTKEISFQHT